jgi:hypothetical protein
MTFASRRFEIYTIREFSKVAVCLDFVLRDVDICFCVCCMFIHPIYMNTM